MSVAKKAVDSTVRKILTHTAEIIMSVVLLVIVCLPLVFAIPIWFQFILLDTPAEQMLLNPLTMFGSSLAIWIVLILGIVSVVIGYPYLLELAHKEGGEEAEPELFEGESVGEEGGSDMEDETADEPSLSSETSDESESEE